MAEFYGVFSPSGTGLSDVEGDLARLYRSRGILAELDPPISGAKVRVRPVGLLISRADCKLMKDEISPAMAYLHHRTGEDIDIFCMGYIHPDNKNHNVVLPHQRPVPDVLYINSYDAEAFVKVVKELEAETNWKYGGETELILLNSFACRVVSDDPRRNGEDVDVSLDFSSAFTIRLEQALASKMIPSVMGFLETVIRSARTYEDHDLLQEVRGHLVLRAGKKGLMQLIASWLKLDAHLLENVANSQIVDLRKNFDAPLSTKFIFQKIKRDIRAKGGG